MKIKTILSQIETHFPLTMQESWDNSGLQVGNVESECERVLVCLNVDYNTIHQAIQHNCQLMISHHPFLFHSVSTIDLGTTKGQDIYQLLTHNIAVYSLHTNYDKLAMNEVILKGLGCDEISLIEGNDILRLGTFKEAMSFDAFIDLLKTHFHLPYLRYCGTACQNISKVALCAGSGHDEIDLALNHADVYLTGDLTYSHAMDIILKKQGCVIELPHFIEEAFKKDISHYLPIEVIMAEEYDYFKTI